MPVLADLFQCGRNVVHVSHMRRKEKVTLRIPNDLIAEYRDWSWEARSQLSELVEQALSRPMLGCKRTDAYSSIPGKCTRANDVKIG